MTDLAKPQFGRLQTVALREGWTGEATDFRPWLAQLDNIAMLGETIQMELEVESQEKNVGPFRADILCRDTLTSNYVLIDGWSEVGLYMSGSHAKEHYATIEATYKAEIDARLSNLGELLWAWMAKALVTMDGLFRPIVKNLDASEWIPPDESSTTGSLT